MSLEGDVSSGGGSEGGVGPEGLGGAGAQAFEGTGGVAVESSVADAAGFNTDFGGTDPEGQGMGVNVAAQTGQGGEHTGLSPGEPGVQGGPTSGIMGGLGFSLDELAAAMQAQQGQQ